MSDQGMMMDKSAENTRRTADESLTPDFSSQVWQVTSAMEDRPRAFALTGATKIDATGILHDFWLVAGPDGSITATGTGAVDSTGATNGTGAASGSDANSGVDPAFAAACADAGLDPHGPEVVDAHGLLVVPGYIDIHAHGGWGASFDDGPEGLETARACHAWHGTTRQVCSLITNPLDVMCRNISVVREAMGSRPDILGSHLEGPFLALSRKGAHDPACLRDPEPAAVRKLLGAAQGTIRQITLAPERAHGLEAIRTLAAAGVIPAVGHTDADYPTARAAFDADARILTHLFNAMNGLHHRNPGPIPAAVEDPRVTIELINDGFHVQDPMLRLGFSFAPHRTAFVTDAMSATGCPDGHYKLGELDVNVEDGHARLVSNGAIAGSTLLLERSVRRAVQVLGIDPPDAVEAATLTPARALGLDRPNSLTGAPLGLLRPGYAADALLLDPSDWSARHVWCAGRRIR